MFVSDSQLFFQNRLAHAFKKSTIAILHRRIIVPVVVASIRVSRPVTEAVYVAHL